MKLYFLFSFIRIAFTLQLNELLLSYFVWNLGLLDLRDIQVLIVIKI